MTKLSEAWISGIQDELSRVDFDALYKTISSDKTYDRSGLRRLCLLGLFLADDKKKGNFVPILGHYEALLRDDDYSLLLEEVLRVVVVLQQVVKPDTQTNRLYI